MRILILLSACFLISRLTAQNPTEFAYSEYMNQVITHHPIAMQASLQNDLAEANTLQARGNLDPKVYFTSDQKQFKETDYYRFYEGKVSIPTLIGLEVNSKFEQASGDFLNPERSTPENGLWNIGVEVDLLRGFLFNDRRAALQLAETYTGLAQIERILLLNQLTYSASVAYSEWAANYESLLEMDEGIQLAETYLENVSESVRLGDKPAIDSIEASTILRDRQTVRNQILQEFQKSQWMVGQFLWQDQEAVLLQQNVVPQSLETIFPVAINTNQEISTLPLLQKEQLKIEQLEIKRRLTREQLKPDLNIGYYQLLNTDNSFVPESLRINNMKYGINFSMPVFRRKARGKLNQLNTEMQLQNLALQNKQNELLVKINATETTIELLQEQKENYEQLIQELEILLEAEITKFNYGESSVFLVNKRQEKLIETQIKLIETEQKLTNQLYYLNYLLNNQ